MPKEITVGGRRIAIGTATEIVAEYLNSPDNAFAYPSYDRYETNGDPNALCDGDLLAPVLLNVKVSIKAFAHLGRRRGEIERALRVVPDVDLANADDDACAAISAVFAILDTKPRPSGALLTTLAKILHRKRPTTIPLYDTFVRSVYYSSRIPYARSRSWQEYTRLLLLAMRDDLSNGVWADLASLTPDGDPPITPLRALDIVAWRAGRDGLGVLA